LNSYWEKDHRHPSRPITPGQEVDESPGFTHPGSCLWTTTTTVGRGQNETGSSVGGAGRRRQVAAVRYPCRCLRSVSSRRPCPMPDTPDNPNAEWAFRSIASYRGWSLVIAGLVLSWTPCPRPHRHGGGRVHRVWAVGAPCSTSWALARRVARYQVRLLIDLSLPAGN